MSSLFTDRYDALGPLGGGSLGEVVLAEERGTGRKLAIKQLSPALQRYPQAVVCLATEAEKIQALAIPGIVSIIDHSLPADPAAWVATEYHPEGSLAGWLKRQRPRLECLDPAMLMQQMAETLSEAHARGLFHGDLHAGNVLLVTPPAGLTRARLMDFEVARVAARARDAGAALVEARPEVLACRAPEQLRGLWVPDCKADVYALAVLLLQMLGLSPAELAGAPPSLFDPTGIGPMGSHVPPLLQAMLTEDPRLRPAMEEVARELARPATVLVDAAVKASSPLSAGACPPLSEMPTLVVGASALNTMPTLVMGASALNTMPTLVMGARPAPAPPPRAGADEQPAAHLDEHAAAPPEEQSTAPHAPQPTARQQGPAAQPAAFPVDIGQCIGSYRLVGKLGEGGMGVVFDAQHTRLSRRAAIKVLRPEFSRNPDMVARFFTEAESVNVINHPAIVNVFEFGQLPDQTVYIVMEYLQGETLQKRLRRSGGHLGLDGLRLMREIASAVAAAHEHHIIHRDLKPDNVMIVADPDVPGGERAKVVDFGIAKMKQAAPRGLPHEHPDATGDPHHTRTGMALGTPFYMSPEQFRDAASVTDKADVYSLGVMLYEALAGHPPFIGDSISELEIQHLSALPRPLREVDGSIPVRLAALVQRMLAKDPALRPPMSEVAAALDQMVLGKPRMSSAKVAALSLGSAALCACLGFAVFHFVWQTRVDLPALRARALVVLREGLRDTDPAIRGRAAGLVAQGRDVNDGAMLGPLLADRDPRVQAQAAAGLRYLGARALVPALVQAVQQVTTGAARVQMVGALLELGDPFGETVLRAALRADEQDARRLAVLLLAQRGDREARELLLQQQDLGEDRVAALGELARFGDRDAEEALRRCLRAGQDAGTAAGQGAEQGGARLGCAEALARNDDDQARAFLVEVAQRESPQRLRAARILTELDDPSFFELFRGRFRSDKTAPGERELAAAGLGACGRRDGAPLLSKALPRESGHALRLRLSAAGAILEIVAADPTLLAQDSLNLVQSGLSDPRWGERVLAALALGDAAPQLGLPLLTKAIKDPHHEVRRGAAHALGRTAASGALPLLGLAIDDDVVVVRQEVIHSIGRVGQGLLRRGESVKDAARMVAARAGRGAPEERLVSLAALARLGERGHEGDLLGWLRASDPAVRRQAVEAWGLDPAADPQVLRDALRDPAAAVRVEASVQLGERGLADGVAVLQQALGAGSADAVRARGALQRLGVATAGVLTLGSAPEAERPAMVAAAHSLSAEEALALLRQGTRDPAIQVRLQVIEELGDTPQLARAAGGHKVLRALLDDPEPLVRSRAGLLAGKLGLRPGPEQVAKAERKQAQPAAQQPSTGRVQVLTQAVPPDLATQAPTPDLAPPPAQVEPPPGEGIGQAPHRGHIRVEAEAQVRFQVDRHPAQVAPAGPVAVSPGRHRVSYVRGTIEVEVPAGATETVRVPVTLGQQWLEDGVAAFMRGDLAGAQVALGQARALLTRAHPSHAEWYSLLYYQGRLYAAQGRWLQAMSQYEQLRDKLPEAQRSAAQRAQIREAEAQAAPHLGRLRVSKIVDRACRTTEMWLVPGEHVVEVDRERIEVRVRAGEVTAVERCK